MQIYTNLSNYWGDRNHAAEWETPIQSDGRKRAKELLADLFRNILPKHGMVLRKNQLSLSLTMLDALWGNKLVLCEAEVGTGKTHAYILAAIVYRLFQGNASPTVISTSTIALQKALTEEYIPQISAIRLEHRIINRPLTFAVRKGKSHYACDDRVRNYLSSIRHNSRPEDGALIDTLNALSMGASTIDLDALPKALDFLLYEDIWSRETPCILTSGTLSISGDFGHFMHRTGIDLLEPHRLLTASKASPFDYENHALLYLPEDMPFPDVKNGSYMEKLLERLAELIGQTHRHTLVLFTSYRMMEIVYQELAEPNRIAYPLFMMGKGRLDAIKSFRKSGNGVLLASDSAGEGIDLPGDILSSLVVVRLPFPTPDPVSE